MDLVMDIPPIWRWIRVVIFESMKLHLHPRSRSRLHVHFLVVVGEQNLSSSRMLDQDRKVLHALGN